MQPGHGPHRGPPLHGRWDRGAVECPTPGSAGEAPGAGDQAALAELLDDSAVKGITWSVPALCEWLRVERGVEISTDWLGELLRREGFRWKRTRDSVRHKADPVLQQARPSPAGGLAALRQAAHAGDRDLIFLDESGFAPTMPTGYTWSRIGQRAVVPKEDTRNRRVNVLGAKIIGSEPGLLWRRTSGKIDAEMLLDFVCVRLAGLGGGAAVLDLAADGLGLDIMPVWERRRPCTVELDNASAHTANAFKGRRRQLAKIGVELFYLPRYSPELNDIELVWRQAKYEDHSQCAHTSVDSLGEAVDRAMTQRQDRIRGSAKNFATTARTGPALQVARSDDHGA
ncbi:transposase [Streptomyces sp. NPDC093544]|uniref:transposase n=1 Tax=Streptomyces sp. NPDC093544 TaxID=3155200 RepID=UPI00343B01C5